MDVVEASDNPNLCVGDDEGHFNFKWHTSFDKKTSHSDSCKDYESEDDDDVPLSARFPKKRDTITLPVKKVSDNNSSLCGLMKKSKVSPTPYDDNVDNDNNDDDEDDDVPIFSRMKAHAMSIDLSFSSLKKQLAFVEKSFEECEGKREVEEKILQSIKRDIEKCCKELENKKKEISDVGRIKEAYKKMQGKIEECVEEFVAKESQLSLMENLIGERKQELNTKKLELRKVMDDISKQKELEGQLAELENDLVSKQKQFESRMKDLESKEKQLDGRDEGFESKEDEFQGRVEKLESEKKHFESRLKDLESIEKKFDGQMKEFLSKEEEFNGKLKEFKSKEEQFKGQVTDFKLNEKKFEEQWKELKSKENKFKVLVKELKLKDKRFGALVKDPESKLNKLDEQLKEPELTEKQYALIEEYFDEENESDTCYMDDEFSPAIVGTSLQLLPFEQTDEPESPGDDIQVNLQGFSDPAHAVLDIIQNPIIQKYKKGDNDAIIEENHIFLLEQLMKISPHIKTCVKEEALKLALDLKANMEENTENNLVLGFLLLLSIYQLVTYFNEDEVLELFAFVAQHKIAVELFETLGFANKVSGKLASYSI
ncbi:frigida-LIKE protein [Medicago truncatula]|uniref:FRIGIDA-like protein n=1 Tax=Medicago truncatula TaxID=3880 RepID=A0A072VCG5_MEDTR|nr:frigida-LIKE protein [Medicago truncatula]